MNPWAMLRGLPCIWRGLDESDAPSEPMALFQRWYAYARGSALYWPNSMSLATSTPDGRPSNRLLLLKGVDARGFVFYTNHDSRKGRELDANPRAALAFHWNELLRQVRAEGSIERVSDAEADAYFASRERGKQVGAWASAQSSIIASRSELISKYDAAEKRFEGGPVPRPPNWGGYRLVPVQVEFWQGRAHRLHDRLLYRREGESWARCRLSP